MSRARILMVGHWDPTGRTNGSVLRMLGTAGALATIGDVDYLQRCGRSWRSPGDAVRHREPGVGPFARWIQVSGFGVPHRWKGPLRYPWALGATLAPGRARPLLAARYPRIAERDARRAVPDLAEYDLLWFVKLETVLAFWPLFEHAARPRVVDVDDLVTADRDQTPPTAAVSSLATAGAALEARIDTLDRRAWQRWLQRVEDRADAVVLANPAEAGSLRSGRVHVVPNGKTPPARRGVRPPATRPTFTFVGGMHYFPNRDAAGFLVTEVVPLLRAKLGDGFEVRLVGEAPPDAADLARDPDVTVTGYVDDLDRELGRADVVVVPLRHGSGTRLKILEAFAHEIPVASTSIGASGLHVASGRELLLADTAAELADACIRLAGDQPLRQHLTDAAYDLVVSTYDWSVITARVEAVVDGAVTAFARLGSSTRNAP